MSLYPLQFQPIYKERVWGGRSLADVYGRPLPEDKPIGESWEIVDRPDEQSVVSSGPLAGQDLQSLIATYGAELHGGRTTPDGRFPLLLKILDARDDLSLQVHPPADVAPGLGGEPKTEAWYFTRCEPDAKIYAGLRSGVTRAQFRQALDEGTVAEQFSTVPVEEGTVFFIPSGRVHGLGAGNLLFEIQQNSDTTYRVYDWDRVGLDGLPRPLHIEQSLESIDFDDYEPRPSQPDAQYIGPGASLATFVQCSQFNLRTLALTSPDARCPVDREGFVILGAIDRPAVLTWPAGDIQIDPGSFTLLPAALEPCTVRPQTGTCQLFWVD